MFSSRWKALTEVIDKCEYTSPDRLLSEDQAAQLFHAFLLQIKENEGIVFFIGNIDQTHFSDAFFFDLKIPSQSFNVTQADLLPFLLKKNDLLITLLEDQGSPISLEFGVIAHALDIPLITLSGGSKICPSRKTGDLNFHFPTDDLALVSTAQYLFLKSIIDSWSFDLLPPMQDESKMISIPKHQTSSPQIML